MKGRHYLILLAVQEDNRDVETDILAEVYIEGVVFASDSLLEDPCEGRLHVAQSHLDYKIWD